MTHHTPSEERGSHDTGAREGWSEEEEEEDGDDKGE